MSNNLAKHFLDDARKTFRDYKALGDKSFEQLTDEEFFVALDEESNSIGVVIKHMAGNMLSRWTDFLTTDGEKPTRNRDMEFVLGSEATREELLAYWEQGWRAVFDAVEPLQPEDVLRKVFIRGKEHTVMEAITRQLTHYAYHTGQIVFLAKHFRSSEWKTLSIPRNRSAEFNTYMAEQKQVGEGVERSRLNEPRDFISKSEGNKQ
ncbi:MAG TPA: DUF1572 family protein [Pyrinomonadaceae bacterium]|jgi:hypothetical protein